MLCFLVFFFFQAEDGIRDLYVTGVQTCALPICCVRILRVSVSHPGDCHEAYFDVVCRGCAARLRSEEHTSELQSRRDLVCRLLLEKKKRNLTSPITEKKQKQKYK